MKRDPWLWGLLGSVLAVGILSMPALRYDGDVNAWEMEAESLVYQGRIAVRAEPGPWGFELGVRKVRRWLKEKYPDIKSSK